MSARLSNAEVLKLLPQQPPMRFVSEIVELDDTHIVTRYTWTEIDCAGHFPGNPIVPGIKIIESAGQAGQCWSVYLLSATLPIDEIVLHVGLFTAIDDGRFRAVVRPGDTTRMHASFGDSGYLRQSKFVSEIEACFEGGARDDEPIFSGRLSGVWMLREETDLGSLG